MDRDDELLKLSARLNGLARAWLHLAAAVEMHGVLDPEAFDKGLRRSRWPDAVEPFDAEARKTVGWLLDQLAEARASRLSQGQPR